MKMYATLISTLIWFYSQHRSSQNISKALEVDPHNRRLVQNDEPDIIHVWQDSGNKNRFTTLLSHRFTTLISSKHSATNNCVKQSSNLWIGRKSFFWNAGGKMLRKLRHGLRAWEHCIKQKIWSYKMHYFESKF